MTPAPVRRERRPPPLVVRATAGRLAVLKAEFTFWSHAPRAADAIGARDEIYDDSEADIPVAVRTNGVLGQVIGTGAYPDSAASAGEVALKARIRPSLKFILYRENCTDDEERRWRECTTHVFERRCCSIQIL